MNVISSNSHTVVFNNGQAIVQDNNILLQNNTTLDLMFVPLTDEIVNEFNIQVSNDVELNNNVDEAARSCTKLWTKSNTLYLIQKIKENDDKFTNDMKKNVWTKIASECEATFKQKVTAQICETKWKTLKRTYKTITLNNKSTGQKRRYWEFYAVMHEIMYDKPEIIPTATCSNISGLQVKDVTEAQSNIEEKVEPSQLPSTSSTSDNASDSTFARKRKLKANAAEKRHSEKMQKLDRFNELFAEMIKKM